ncbi:MAG: ATP-binding protein [Limnobacter sp.]|uniref:sensor histidine kinase n=1 Tax=Limnobacter sp. TaxID=2003368 RepID=UPI00391BDA5D
MRTPSSLWRQAAQALGLLGLVTLLVEWVLLDLSPLAGIIVYLFAVMVAASSFSFRVSLVTALVSYLLVNYLVVHPRYSLQILDTGSALVLVLYLLTSIRINTLVHRLREKSAALEQALSYTVFARRLSEALMSPETDEEAAQAVRTVFDDALGKRVNVALHPDVRLTTEGAAVEPSLLALATQQLQACLQRLRSVERANQAQVLAREREVRSQLLLSISHDLRTPLTTILGAATALNAQSDKLSAQEQTRLLQSIEAEAYHMATSTENVLSLIRLGQLSALPEPLAEVFPDELLEVTVRRYTMRQNPPVFQIDNELPPCVIPGNFALLSQALANLVDNALAAQHPERSLRLHVHPWAHDAIDPICITVLDNGPGFPDGFSPAHLRPLLTDPTRTHRGHGLGLTIVQSIVELHGGRLLLDNQPGGGAAASLVLPARWLDLDSVGDGQDESDAD